jgi:AraC-like DNA-binding protein
MTRHLKEVQNWDDLAQSVQYRLAQAKAVSGANARQLRRRIIREFQTTSQKWLNDQRFQVGTQMLRKGEAVKNVAAALGFANLQSFSHFWRKATGVSPRLYVELQQKARMMETEKPPGNSGTVNHT